MLNKEETENIKDDLRTLHKVLWNERREGIYAIQETLKYINLLEQKKSILDKVTDKLKETIKIEREFMKDTEHKSMAFHYSNGREVLSKEILEIIEGEKK